MTIRDLNRLQPEFRAKLEAALAEARSWGAQQNPPVHFLVIETYRPQKRQDELYAQGRTKPGRVVTWTKHSRHTDRVAADVVPVINGRVMWRRKDLFDQWGACAERQDLRWGGRFRNYDGPHVEAAE